MIKTFHCKETEKIFRGEISQKFPIEIQNIARKKLKMLNHAANLRDLLIFPGNRLEALKGNRRYQHSIRVNQKYRICFQFIDSDFYQVELVDYH